MVSANLSAKFCIDFVLYDIVKYRHIYIVILPTFLNRIKLEMIRKKRKRKSIAIKLLLEVVSVGQHSCG